MSNRTAVFSKDTTNKKLTIVRSFAAALDLVWKAWTTKEILDQWWAPKPYRAETKRMDFREGGQWLYAMVGPEGDRSWCLVDYHSIQPQQSITSTDGFSDEDGNLTVDFPRMHWDKQFLEAGNETTVTIVVSFDQVADMEKYLEMGFQEGFTAGLENLDAYLDAH